MVRAGLLSLYTPSFERTAPLIAVSKASIVALKRRGPRHGREEDGGTPTPLLSCQASSGPLAGGT